MLDSCTPQLSKKQRAFAATFSAGAAEVRREQSEPQTPLSDLSQSMLAPSSIAASSEDGSQYGEDEYTSDANERDEVRPIFFVSTVPCEASWLQLPIGSS